MSQRSDKSADETSDRTQRDLLAWSLLAGLLLLVALGGPLLAGRVYTGDDLGAFHLPVRAFYARQLAAGHEFDWMPQIYSGFYLTGEGQAGTYHPLHLLLYRYLPLHLALGCEWLASYPLMLVGTWLFLRRRLGRSDAAMLGSLIFTFSGFNLLHFVHPNAIAVVAHIPWLLWAIDVMLFSAGRTKVALAQAAIALLTASQLLLGYPQYVWFSLITEAAYALFILVRCKYVYRNGCEVCITCSECAGCVKHPWGRLAVAVGTGVLLGGIQLVPTVEALAHSARQSADAAFAYSGSLHPLNLIQLVGPYLLVDRVIGQNTHEAGMYAGAVPLMLVVWLLLNRQQLGVLGPFARAAGLFGLAALLLAFGKYALVYSLQTHLPLVGRFRFPCRYLVLFHLAVAVVAAIGFLMLARENRRRRSASPVGGVSPVWRFWEEFRPLSGVVAASVAAAVAGATMLATTQLAPMPAVLAGPLLIGTAAVLVALAARGVRGALAGLILFTAADLGFYGLSYSVYPHTARLERFVASAATPPVGSDTAPTDRKCRVVASPLHFDRQGLQTGNLITLAGWRRADGYAGLAPQQLLDYRCLPALRAAGVRWIRRSEVTSALTGLIRHRGDWQEVPRPLPRVRLVGRAVASADPAADIRRIDLDSTALTEVPLAMPPPAPGRVSVVAERPGRLQIQCDSPTPQLLVLSESFQPGWRATVDGSPRTVWRVNGDFMGCPVRPGEHLVSFEFRPRSLVIGRILSCMGLALVSVCFFVRERMICRERPSTIAAQTTA